MEAIVKEPHSPRPALHDGNMPLGGAAMTTATDQGLTVGKDVRPIQRLARVTGLLYLLIAILGMFSGTVSAGFIAKGNAGATAHNILASPALFRGSLIAWIILLLADVAVAITLFVLLKPANKTLSLLAATIRAVYVAIVGISLPNLFNALSVVTSADYRTDLAQHNAQALTSLNAFSTGFHLGLVIFGIHLALLGYLLFVSRYVPRVISVLVTAGGIGYVLDNLGLFFVPDYSTTASAVFLIPAVVGELGLTAWLLVKGVQVCRPAALGHRMQVQIEDENTAAS